MAYRKTEKVLAGIEERKTRVIWAASREIAKHGLEGLTTDGVADRAGFAAGLLYKYFPDKTELVNAVIAAQIKTQLDAMNEAAEAERYPLNALAQAVAVFYGLIPAPRMMNALMGSLAYRAAIRKALEELIKPAVDMSPRTRAMHAAAILGAVVASQELEAKPNDVVAFVLRAIGVPNAAASRVLA